MLIVKICGRSPDGIRNPTSFEIHMWGKRPATNHKRLAGVTPEANLREHAQTPPQSVNQAFHSGFETHRRCHQMSKTRVSMVPQKSMCPPKFF